MNDIFSLRDVIAGYPDALPVLRDLTWTVREGESWAVVGPVGSGKTTLVNVLLGSIRPQRGGVAWPLLDRLRAAGRDVAWPSQVIEVVSFREESRLFSTSRHYYQQRFNFIDPLDDLTLEQFLGSGAVATNDAIAATAAALGVESLRPLSLLKLSNGQMRRARIARALLAKPELLILDDPFIGLDSSGRDDVSRILGDLARNGQRLLLMTRPDMVPAWITNVLHLAPGLPGGTNALYLAPGLPGEMQAISPGKPGAICELHHVNVIYGERRILDDVNWTVNAGERWAVLGPNGSGKSTLLSLLCGDHPQAYANDVRLFGRRRGTGESIWDIKKRVGLVSPELHLYFHEPLTVTQTVATGFSDTMAPRPTTAEQDAGARELLGELGIGEWAERPFRRLSTGEQRLVLLARALVKRPELLILDEPFQGFDAALASQLRDWLDARLGADQTLLFVTHHAEEIPRSVTRRLILDNGRAQVE